MSRDHEELSREPKIYIRIVRIKGWVDMVKNEPNKVRKNITIRKDQAEKLEEEKLNLSAIVREDLDKRGICKPKEDRE